MFLKLPPDGPLYLRVYEALRQSMLKGALASGDMLPGTRELAADLGVSRTVVLQAYALLDAEGYTVTRAGVGAFVGAELPDDTLAPGDAGAVPDILPVEMPLSQYGRRLTAWSAGPVGLPPHAHPADIIDMRFGDAIADTRALEEWWRTLAHSGKRLAGMDAEPPAWGLQELRAVVAEHLRRDRGVDAEAESVVIVTGAQQALDLIGRVLVDEGTVVGLEEPHYEGARHVFHAYGAQLVACPVDDDGLDIEQHEPALHDARVLMVMPSHQFPTGAVMPLHRRKALLQWAQQRPVYLVEEDIDCEYRYGISAMPSLQSMDRHGRVIYIGSFARMLLPGLRLGFVVVPRGLRDRFRSAKQLSDRGSSVLMQVALLDFIASGAYEHGRRRLQRSMDHKRRCLLAALREHLGDTVVVRGADAGVFVHACLPQLPVARMPALLAAARERGLHVYSAEKYFLGACLHAALVLGYANTDASRMDDVGRRLAAAYRTAAGE